MTTRRFRTSSSASIAGADRSITNLFASISNEECRHDVTKLYEGRLRSHARNFEGMKRKWEGFTGVPLPKKLKTSSDAAHASASSAPAVASSVVPPAATLPCVETDEANNESIGKENSNNVKVDNVEHDNTKTAIGDSAALKKPEVLAATKTKKATASSTTKVDTRPTTAQPTAAAQSKQTTAASQQPPPPLPHHPHDDIDVDNLKWNDLRKIVKQHGLSTAGRKFELQERLRSHLEEERRVRLVEWNEVHGGGVVEEEVEEEVCDEVMEEEKKVEENEEVVETEVTKEEEAVKPAEEVEEEKADDDVVAMEEDVQEEKPAKSVEASSSSGGGGGKVMSMVRQLSAKNEEIMGGGEAMMPATTSRTYETARKVTDEEDSSKLYNAVVPPPPPSSMKKEPPKSALKPSKYAPAASSAAIHSTPVDRAAGKNLLASLKKDPPAFATNDKKMSSSKLEPNSLQKTKLISSIIEETVPSGTSSAFKSAKVESAKLQEKKKNMAAASEARKARLAEMREKGLKSATKTTNSAHPKYATASSTLKKMAAHSSASKPNNVKSTSSSILRAKMNEKVAMAEKSAATSAATATASSSVAKPEPMPAVPSASSNTSSISKFQHSTSVPPSQLKSKKALKSILDPANTSPAKKPAAVSKPKVEVEEKPLSPMQTYDMSDREEESDESDSDDEYESQRPKKKVPEWAQRHNLHRALERQFADGPNRLDPDKIFGEVLTCNLEEIFDKKKSRYQRRTSSGNWTKDHVTIAEKLTYKRTMGYQK